MERESQSVLLNLQLVKGRVNHMAVVEISNRLPPDLRASLLRFSHFHSTLRCDT